MKRVTILIPDQIISVFSSPSSVADVKRLDVTPALMVRALTTNDYHEAVFFDRGVRVVSIEDAPEGGGGSGSDRASARRWRRS